MTVIDRRLRLHAPPHGGSKAILQSFHSGNYFTCGIIPERGVLAVGMPEAKVLMGREGNLARFKIVGIGTFQTAVGFKATYTELLADGVRDFVIDLEACDLLDSTFLGVILGLALKVRQLVPPGHVHVIKPNEIVRSLFRGTGLDQIFEMNEPGGGGSA